MGETCQANALDRDLCEVMCDLPAGHGGRHVDNWAGWEWRSSKRPTTDTDHGGGSADESEA